MPQYPSNFNNSGLGVESSATQNNVTRRRELRDVVDSNGLTTLSNPTNTWSDLITAFTNLQTEIGTVDTWAAPVAGAVAADAGNSTLQLKTNLASSTDDAYNGYYFLVTSGTRKNDWSKVTDYNGTTKIATLSPALGGIPTAADTIAVVAPQTPSSGFNVDITSLSTGEKSYISNHLSLKINDLQRKIQNLTEKVLLFREDVAAINSAGVPATSRYPSGQNRGY